MKNIASLYITITNYLNNNILAIHVLFLRIWIANIFWKSGLTKFDDFENALDLFKNIYRIPYMDYKLAAYLATTAELICPIMLLLGIGARFAGMTLMCMAIVIQIFVFQHQEHLYWIMIMGVIILRGPDKISLDHFIKKSIGNKLKSYH